MTQKTQRQPRELVVMLQEINDGRQQLAEL
jgi:hypothetical protein